MTQDESQRTPNDSRAIFLRGKLQAFASGAEDSEDTLVVVLRHRGRRTSLGMWEWADALLYFILCAAHEHPDEQCMADIIPETDRRGPKYKGILTGLSAVVSEWNALRGEVLERLRARTPRRVLFVGHMMGGAMCTVALTQLLLQGELDTFYSKGLLAVEAYTFAAPPAITNAAQFYLQNRIDWPKQGEVRVGHNRIIHEQGFTPMVAKSLQCISKKKLNSKIRDKATEAVASMASAAIVSTIVGAADIGLTGGLGTATSLAVSGIAGWAGGAAASAITGESVEETLSVAHVGKEFHLFGDPKENIRIRPERCTGCQVHLSPDPCKTKKLSQTVASAAEVFKCGQRSRSNWPKQADNVMKLYDSVFELFEGKIGYEYVGITASETITRSVAEAFAADAHVLNRHSPWTCVLGSASTSHRGAALCVDNFLAGTYQRTSGTCPAEDLISWEACGDVAKSHRQNAQERTPFDGRNDFKGNAPGCQFGASTSDAKLFRWSPPDGTGTCSTNSICLCRLPDYASFPFNSTQVCPGEAAPTWGGCQASGGKAEEQISREQKGYCWYSELTDGKLPLRKLKFRPITEDKPQCPLRRHVQGAADHLIKEEDKTKCFKCTNHAYKSLKHNDKWPPAIQALYPF